MRLKVLVDLLMSALLVAAFAYPFTANRYHEANGIALGLLFLLHHALNRWWYVALFKGKYSFRRIIGTIINFALLIAMILILFVAVPISNSIFAFLEIEGGASLSRIHIASANWIFILISLHLGLHWDVVMGRSRKATTGAEPMRGRVFSTARIAAFAMALYGFQAASHRNIGPKLILYYSFDFARAGDTIPRFILDYVAIMVFCIWMAYHFLKVGAHVARRR